MPSPVSHSSASSFHHMLCKDERLRFSRSRGCADVAADMALQQLARHLHTSERHCTCIFPWFHSCGFL